MAQKIQRKVKRQWSQYGTLHGTYNLINKDKYCGAPNITYRSSWEKKIFYWLDTQPSIKQWGSESVVVSYKTPFDNLLHKYYIDVDFWAKEANSEKEYTHFIVEIKPFCQTIPPVKGPRTRESTYRKACETYITNVCKWNAALEYANKTGKKFKIWTEKGIIDWKFKK